MENLFSDKMLGIGLGFILSIAIFGAFWAGQALERLKFTQSFCELDLAKLKMKTATKLELCYKEYLLTDGEFRVPEDQRFVDIVEKLIELDDSLMDKIFGLTQIYYDLILPEKYCIESPLIRLKRGFFKFMVIFSLFFYKRPPLIWAGSILLICKVAFSLDSRKPTYFFLNGKLSKSCGTNDSIRKSN